MHIKVTVPKYLTAEQKAIMLAWAATEKLKDGTIKGLDTVDEKKKSEKVVKKTEGKGFFSSRGFYPFFAVLHSF